MIKNKKEISRIEEYQNVRHPTDNTAESPTDTHSFISIGKKEMSLLRYLSETKNLRFNVKSYSRLTGIKRPTVYDMLDRLIKKELVIKPHAGNHKITEKGITTLTLSVGEGVGNVRRECRERLNLSTHYLKYSLPFDIKTLNKDRLKDLNALDIQQRKLQSITYYDIYFADATISIFTKKMIIRIHDLVTEDTEEAHFKAFELALSYVKVIKSIGIEVGSIELNPAHYARMESIFAEALQKIDNRYFLDLGDGKKFWIDNSGGKAAEDETNDFNVRERLDSFLKDMFKSESLMSDMDKMKEVAGSILKLKIIEHKDNSKIKANLLTLSKLNKDFMDMMVNINKPLDDGKNKSIPDYFG